MIEKKIYNLIKKIYPYPRSITGIGTLKTLQEFKKYIPDLKIIRVKSGKKLTAGLCRMNGILKEPI